MRIRKFAIIGAFVVLMILTACNSANTNTNSSEQDEKASPAPQAEKAPENQVPENQALENQVEVKANYLFTANEGGSISKIDVASNEVLDTFEVEGAVHNVQISPDGKVLAATVVPEMEKEGADHDDDEHGMAMNGFTHFFDVASGALIKSVEVGNHPAHVVYTNDGKYAWVTNNEDNNVSVIETVDYKVIQTVETGKGPHGFRISADDKFAYVANMGEDTVSVIDIAAMKESKRIKVGATPVTTAITADGKILMVTLNTENVLAIVDLTTEQVDKIEVGIGPAQVYVQADDRYVFVANQGTAENPSTTVTKVDLAERKVAATIETGDGAHGLLTSPDTKRLYVTNMFEDTLSIIDNETNQVISTINTGKTPNGVTMTP